MPPVSRTFQSFRLAQGAVLAAGAALEGRSYRYPLSLSLF